MVSGIKGMEFSEFLIRCKTIFVIFNIENRIRDRIFFNGIGNENLVSIIGILFEKALKIVIKAFILDLSYCALFMRYFD